MAESCERSKISLCDHQSKSKDIQFAVTADKYSHEKLKFTCWLTADKKNAVKKRN